MLIHFKKKTGAESTHEEKLIDLRGRHCVSVKKTWLETWNERTQSENEHIGI